MTDKTDCFAPCACARGNYVYPVLSVCVHNSPSVIKGYQHDIVALALISMQIDTDTMCTGVYTLQISNSRICISSIYC